ncbi:Cyanate hydratase [Ceratobasidium sp. 414]|nr:Cyanate hydratase [Ceratobasidium sp. 414]
MASAFQLLRSTTRINIPRQLTPLTRPTRGAIRFSSSTAVASSPILPGLPPVCKQLFDAKARKGMSFAEVGRAIGKDEIWTAALFYGQAKPSAQDLAKLGEALDVPFQSLTDSLGEHWWPTRGLGPDPPQDPVIYRLHEVR